MEVVVVLIAAVLVVQHVDAVTTIAVLSHVLQQLLCESSNEEWKQPH